MCGIALFRWQCSERELERRQVQSELEHDFERQRQSPCPPEVSKKNPAFRAGFFAENTCDDYYLKDFIQPFAILEIS